VFEPLAVIVLLLLLQLSIILLQYLLHHYHTHQPVRIGIPNIIIMWVHSVHNTTTHLLKCSRIFSSRILSGRFPTQRWRVSLTIMSPTLHHSGTRPNTQVAHNDSTAVQRIPKRENHTPAYTHKHARNGGGGGNEKPSDLRKHRGRITHARAPRRRHPVRNHTRTLYFSQHTREDTLAVCAQR